MSQFSKGTSNNFLQENEDFHQQLKELKDKDEKEVELNIRELDYKLKKAFERQSDNLRQKSMDARLIISNLNTVKSQKNLIDLNN